MAYCYNTNSKMLSIEAMMRAYQTDYNVFSWKPKLCIAERQGGKWNIYYDDDSLRECQNKVKEIFCNKDKLSAFFDLANQVMAKMSNLTDTLYRRDVNLDISVCKQYIEVYSEFLNYYSFSNEFCFKLVEQDVLTRLQKQMNLQEVGDVLFRTQMNNTYTYRAAEVLKMFVKKYQDECSIDENELLDFIDKYQFLFKNVKEGNIKEYIVDSIKKGRILFENTNMINSHIECHELIRKCDENLVETVNNVLRLQNQRLVMREEMIRFNFFFTKLVRNYLCITYGDYFNALDIKNLLDIISVEQLFDIQHLDVTVLHKGRTNTLMFAYGEVLPLNKFHGFESEDSVRQLHRNSNMSLSGQVVCGEGIINGTIKTSLYEEDDKAEAYIYLTKSLHPKDILLSKNVKAIIVDEGGILSHASIIAKELGIPCIINTKISSMIFKEGDSVNVDLNKGIVELVKVNSANQELNCELIPLSDALIDKSLYGNKCVNLCSYFNEYNVVKGYVLSSIYVEKLYKQIKCDGLLELTSNAKMKLQEIFPIIMRSSSLYEDCEKSTAAGLLESVTAIDNFDDFAEAIITICDSSKNNSTDKYLQMMGIMNDQMPAVLIQRYFDFEVLGVALVENEKVTIELKKQNENQFEDYMVNLVDETDSRGENIRIIELLIPELRKLKDKDGMLVEFGLEAGKLYILQIRKYGGKLNV